MVNFKWDFSAHPDARGGKPRPSRQPADKRHHEQGNKMMIRHAFFRRSAAPGLALLLCSTALGGVAGAQDAPLHLGEVVLQARAGEADGNGPVEGFVAEVTGTASKSGAEIREVPQAVNVIGRPEAEARGARSVADFLAYTPGVQAQFRPSTRYDFGTIRGFGGQGGSGSQGWFNFLDGMQLPGAGFAIPAVDAWGLERVEVLKGPASVLYGAVHPGGIVNMSSKLPESFVANEVYLGFGTQNRAEAGFDLGGALDEAGTWRYRVVGLLRDVDGFVDGHHTERRYFAPSLTWAPDSHTSLTFFAGVIDDPTSVYPLFLPAEGTVLRHPSGHRIPYDFNIEEPDLTGGTREQSWVGYIARHDLSESVSLRQSLRYMDIDHTHRGMSPRGYEAPGSTVINRAYASLHDQTNSLVVDTRAEFRFVTGAVGHEVLAGVDYIRLNMDRTSGSERIPGIDFLNPVYGMAISEPEHTMLDREHREQTGLYVQDVLRFGDVTVMAGLRHDWSRISYEAYDAGPGGWIFYDDEPARQSATTGRIGAAWNIGNGWAPYASYATSFEPKAGTDINGEGFEPTTAKQVEVGIRYAPEKGNFMFTASLFDIRQKNVAYETGEESDNCSFYYCQAQVGEVRSRGLELEAKGEVAPGFSLVGSYTYLDAEVTEGVDIVGMPHSGSRVIAVPRHQAALWAQHEFQAGAAEGLTLGAGLRYMGSTTGNYAGTLKVPSVTLMDAAVTYDLGAADPRYRGVKLSLFANNLFDKEYVASCTQNYADEFCYYGTRRSVTAQLNYKW